MAEQRRQTTQPVAWFWDLYRRGLLDLDPPYQRRSVWNQTYKDYFVDTVLLDYPAPAVFLFEDITEDGLGKYAVVDGKQRLAAVFEFLENRFPVSEKASIERLQGHYFTDFGSAEKKRLYSYQFSVEFLPSIDEGMLNNIFDRINRNVSKLTHQELRHAKYDGIFAATAERLSELMTAKLPGDFPRIASTSRRQMKDVELVVQLLLLIEKGVASYSQADLDEAYNERDEEWEELPQVESDFLEVVNTLARWSQALLTGQSKRLKNQADFYSLFGAVLNLMRANALPEDGDAIQRLENFMTKVSDDVYRSENGVARRYYEAARSASNDLAQRKDRVKIIEDVLTGDY